MGTKSPYNGGEFYIKGNLPPSAEAYEYGSGEGVYFIVDAETKAAYDADEPKSDRVYYGILDNYSISFPGLAPGEKLPLEMRGDQRPVVPLEYLAERWELAPLDISPTDTGEGE